MFGLAKAIKFLLLAAQDRVPETEVSEFVLKAEGQTFQVDRYCAINTTPKHTLVFTHGMSRVANRDERLILTAKRLAALGYEILVPLFSKMQSLDIGPQVRHDMKSCFEALISGGHCIENKFSVFAASFSVALVIRSLGLPAIAPHVTAFLGMGGNYSYSSSLPHLLNAGGTRDAYARALTLRMVLSQTEAEHYTQAIDDAILQVADDNFVECNYTNPEKYYQSLNEQDKAFLKPYLDNLFNLDDLMQKNIDWAYQLDKQLDTDCSFKNIKCPVSLVHSATDEMVLAKESQYYYREFKSLGVPCKLVVTPLLDHVEHNFSIRQLNHIVRLVRVFAYFFKNA